jgi:hypothetical protein
MDNTVKLLAINTGGREIATEKHEFPAREAALIQSTILEALNRMGKSSHVLAKFGGKLYSCQHTSARGPSKTYHRAEIRYHPLAKELA